MAKQKRAFWKGDKRFWSPVAMSLGLATFFFGVLRVAPTVPIYVGWVTIVCGIILVFVGFSTAPLKQ
jgi:hypothetical protein